jgi:hypothetical protein
VERVDPERAFEALATGAPVEARAKLKAPEPLNA